MAGTPSFFDHPPGLFNVYRMEDYDGNVGFPYNRRDFYKISLLTAGGGLLSYSENQVRIGPNSLIFTNPMIPYAYQTGLGGEMGYFCLFTEEFLGNFFKNGSLAESPLFKINGNHVLQADDIQANFLRGVFDQMLQEMESSYVHKYDLLRSYVQILIHEALKIEPSQEIYQRGTSASRLSELFLELLERQFPIPSPLHPMRLKNASEFATLLAVHPNHLNRALREVTGKTLRAHITERVLKEAKSLLLHSTWSIAEIGYCLGFTHPTNFYLFFKKHTGLTASAFRSHS